MLIYLLSTRQRPVKRSLHKPKMEQHSFMIERERIKKERTDIISFLNLGGGAALGEKWIPIPDTVNIDMLMCYRMITIPNHWDSLRGVPNRCWERIMQYRRLVGGDLHDPETPLSLEEITSFLDETTKHRIVKHQELTTPVPNPHSDYDIKGSVNFLYRGFINWLSGK